MDMERFDYVDETLGLHEMNKHLQKSRRVSVDLEADSYHHYGEKICLIQIATDRRIFVIDPLKVDLTFMASLLEDDSKEKVFHDGDYDGRMFLTYLGVKPSPIFDTMIAARVLGKEKVGLANLLSDYFQVDLDKKWQKADWSRRPLKEEMQQYAAMDVAYLLPLRDRMAADMEKMGRMAWACEEFSRLLDNLDALPERRASFTRVKGARNLSPRHLAVLQQLLEWREDKARALDVPSFKIVGSERLLKLAATHPRSLKEAEESGILSPRQASLFGGDIMRAIRMGMKVPRAKLPGFPEPARHRRDYSVEKVIRCFKKIRDTRAEELGLDPGFLMPNAVLKAVARIKPVSLNEIDKSGLLKSWQLEVMGDSLAGCLRKEEKSRS
ncbi:MAG: HRDC domain-containing protein [Actinomycetota bacterium]|nr:HRDC domain-containing protein [Actinomycetota bacterium]